MCKKIFITAIDTGIGKTIMTGAMAKYLLDLGKKVITVKLVQTGNDNVIAEDIIEHRKIMEIPLVEEDINKQTCYYTFKYPASPHLSAKLENTEINTETIKNFISKLEDLYEYILIEGAGGIMVPLNRDMRIIDFIKENNYPTILVTCPRLGSINHTMMSLELLKIYDINVVGLIYNVNGVFDPIIKTDTLEIFKYFMSQNFNDTPTIVIEDINEIETNCFKSIIDPL